jgi:hypothetical protein
VQLQYWATYNQANIRKQLQTIEQKITDERMSRVEVLEKLDPLLSNIMDALQERAIASPVDNPSKRLPDVSPDHVLTRFVHD